MQGRIWLLTIPSHDFIPYLPPGVAFVTGQLECGADTGYLHWQVLVHFSRSVRLAAVKKIFGDSCHAELSRSVAAESYVHKEETYVHGTRFELGRRPFKRNCKRDWAAAFEFAKRGEFESVDPGILVPYFGQLQRLHAHFATPEAAVRECFVYWGPTGVGKSRTAWDRAGLDAYPKVSTTKFWDGYRGQDCVVIDEFRGGIGIEHLLRWLDRYPVLVEVKGSAVVLKATKIWITSNLHPKDWYPTLDELTLNALLRRIKITHFDML